ncbi:MAG TPA: hypothetical protein DD435_01970 [Cyanobacteria bacterium UBA8530]|nr:hypothetical protein [Cyanobacteria bacterium UBA8530]
MKKDSMQKAAMRMAPLPEQNKVASPFPEVPAGCQKEFRAIAEKLTDYARSKETPLERETALKGVTKKLQEIVEEMKQSASKFFETALAEHHAQQISEVQKRYLELLLDGEKSMDRAEIQRRFMLVFLRVLESAPAGLTLEGSIVKDAVRLIEARPELLSFDRDEPSGKTKRALEEIEASLKPRGARKDDASKINGKGLDHIKALAENPDL